MPRWTVYSYFMQYSRYLEEITVLVTVFFLLYIQASELQPARVVFDVSLKGRARKVVTLRSALMIKNKMDLPVEVKLHGPSLHG